MQSAPIAKRDRMLCGEIPKENLHLLASHHRGSKQACPVSPCPSALRVASPLGIPCPDSLPILAENWPRLFAVGSTCKIPFPLQGQSLFGIILISNYGITAYRLGLPLLK